MTQFITAPLVVTLIGMTCPVCGVKYGLDDRLRSERLADGKTWWCSNGHSLSFRESEVARERRRAEAAEQREKWAKEDAVRARAAADRAKRSQRATAGLHQHRPRRVRRHRQLRNDDRGRSRKDAAGRRGRQCPMTRSPRAMDPVTFTVCEGCAYEKNIAVGVEASRGT